jgi:hypothetical protein
MLDKPKKKLRVFAESGPLIALAIAAGMVFGIVGPSSAQFFNFGGFQQRPQPQRGGGGFGGGWFGRWVARMVAGRSPLFARPRPFIKKPIPKSLINSEQPP